MKIEAEAKIEKAKIEQETLLQELNEKQKFHEERRNEFDLAKQLRLLPQFNEDDIHKYFQHFEKVASSLSWPIKA